MKPIGVLLADAFQDSEYFLPKIEIEKMGVRTQVISLDSKPVEIYSYFSRIGTLDVDRTIGDSDPADYLGVLVPGGAKEPGASGGKRRGAFVPAQGQQREKARRLDLSGLAVGRTIRNRKESPVNWFSPRRAVSGTCYSSYCR